MRMTIYLPDDLAAMVKEHDDLNVSAVCQEALRAELFRRQAMHAISNGMQRYIVYIAKTDSQAAFVGKEVNYDGHRLTAYITQRGRIALYDDDRQELEVFDTFADLVALEGIEETHPALVADVAEAVGEKYVRELDI